MAIKYHVRLTDDERIELQNLITQVTHHAENQPLLVS